MNAEKEVPIFGSKWLYVSEPGGAHVGVNFAVRAVCQPVPYNVFGLNCHLVANLELRREHQPKLQNKEHTVYESLWQAVARGL